MSLRQLPSPMAGDAKCYGLLYRAGNDPSRVFQMRVRKSFMDKIDNWRRQQEVLPREAEAIRRLGEKGLEAQRAETKKRG